MAVQEATGPSLPPLCITITPNTIVENGADFLTPCRYRGRSPFVNTPSMRSFSASSDMIDGIDVLPKELAAKFRARICCSDAHTLWRCGNYDEAFQALDEGLQLTPKDAELRVFYARCCIEVDEFGQARDHLLKSNNDSWEPHYLYGIMFLREKQLKDAARALQHSLELFDSPPFEYPKNEKSAIFAALGDTFMAEKQFQKAHEHYRSARTLDSQNEDYKSKIKIAQTMCTQDPNLYAHRPKPIISRRPVAEPVRQRSPFASKSHGMLLYVNPQHLSVRTNQNQSPLGTGSSTSPGSCGQTPPAYQSQEYGVLRSHDPCLPFSGVHVREDQPRLTRAQTARHPLQTFPMDDIMTASGSDLRPYNHHHRETRRTGSIERMVRQSGLHAPADLRPLLVSSQDSDSHTSSDSENSVPTPIRFLSQHNPRRTSDSSLEHPRDDRARLADFVSDTAANDSFNDTMSNLIHQTGNGRRRAQEFDGRSESSDSTYDSALDYELDSRSPHHHGGWGGRGFHQMDAGIPLPAVESATRQVYETNSTRNTSSSDHRITQNRISNSMSPPSGYQTSRHAQPLDRSQSTIIPRGERPVWRGGDNPSRPMSVRHQSYHRNARHMPPPVTSSYLSHQHHQQQPRRPTMPHPQREDDWSHFPTVQTRSAGRIPHCGSMEVSTRVKMHDNSPSVESEYSHHTPERKIQVRLKKKLKLRVKRQRDVSPTGVSSGPMIPPPIPNGLLSQGRVAVDFAVGLPPPNTNMRQSPPFVEEFYSSVSSLPQYHSTAIVESLYSGSRTRGQSSSSPDNSSSPEERSRRYPMQYRPASVRSPTNVVYHVT